ncbi:MAG: hypothetical protein RDU30_17545 [Desulfovibrionaceae bacterium]|nr:hypothetical protein [Desulfovibrionaceae bacterium]
MLYTIGYTSYDVPGLVAVAQKLGITAVADVRSMPYSALHPEYNRDKFKDWPGYERRRAVVFFCIS